MGEKPDVIASEIEGIRRETDVIVDELMRRATPQNIVRGAAGGVTGRAGSLVGDAQDRVSGVVEEARSRIDPALAGASHRVGVLADDAAGKIPAPLREYGGVIGGALVALTLGLGVHTLAMISSGRRAMAMERDLEYRIEPKPWYDRRDEVLDLLSQLRSATRKVDLPADLRRLPEIHVPGRMPDLKVSREVSAPSRIRLPGVVELPGNLKLAVYQDSLPAETSTRRREPGMLKRVLWMAMATGMATLGSVLFKRLTATAWRGAMREDPPEK